MKEKKLSYDGFTGGLVKGQYDIDINFDYASLYPIITDLITPVVPVDHLGFQIETPFNYSYLWK